jgi:polar amino acid transport system permease protein
MSDVKPFLPFLARGVLVTLEVTMLALAIALAVALVAGIGRMSKRRPLRLVSGLFIEVFRGTSVIVQLFWFYYALPLFGLRFTPLFAAVLALGLNEGAYGAEIVRGAIQSVPKGQTEAAVALSLSPLKCLRRVILPQAIPAMIPPFGNVSIDLLKATSLVSLVTVSELTFRAQLVRSSTGATTAVFGLILGCYFVLALGFSGVWRLIEARVRIDRTAPKRTRRRGLPFAVGREVSKE